MDLDNYFVFVDLENECANLRRACENAEKSIIALQCNVENLDASRSEIETKYKEMELQNMKLEEEHQASYGKLEEQLMKLKDENSAISTKYENASSQLYTLEKDSHSSLDKKVLEVIFCIAYIMFLNGFKLMMKRVKICC